MTTVAPSSAAHQQLLPSEILVHNDDSHQTAASSITSCRAAKYLNLSPNCEAQQRLRKLLDEEQRRRQRASLDVEKEQRRLDANNEADDDDEDYLKIVQGIQSLCNHSRARRRDGLKQRQSRRRSSAIHARRGADRFEATKDDDRPSAKEKSGAKGSNNNEQSKLVVNRSRARALPKSFYCPLTSHVMVDPVVDHEGQSYERSAIESWLSSGRTTSPVSRRTLKPYHLAPNRALKELIVEYMGPEWASLVEQTSALLPPPRPASPDPPTPHSLAIVPASSTTQAVPTTITTTVANKTSTETKPPKKRLRLTHASPHRTRVDDFLEEISRTSNLSERLNEHGVCAFMYGTLRIVIEVPDQGGTFMIYTTFNDLVPPSPRMSGSSGTGSKEAVVVVVNPFSGEKETRAASDTKLDKKSSKKGAASTALFASAKEKAASRRKDKATSKKEKAKKEMAEQERKEAADAELQKKLLRLNFMDEHTKGGVLSMDPKHDNDVTYSLYGRVEGMHVSDFWATLETFIETALRLHSKLKCGGDVEKEDGKEETSVRVSLGYEPTPRTQRSSEGNNDVEG